MRPVFHPFAAVALAVILLCQTGTEAAVQLSRPARVSPLAVGVASSNALTLPLITERLKRIHTHYRGHYGTLQQLRPWLKEDWHRRIEQWRPTVYSPLSLLYLAERIVHNSYESRAREDDNYSLVYSMLELFAAGTVFNLIRWGMGIGGYETAVAIFPLWAIDLHKQDPITPPAYWIIAQYFYWTLYAMTASILMDWILWKPGGLFWGIGALLGVSTITYAIDYVTHKLTPLPQDGLFSSGLHETLAASHKPFPNDFLFMLGIAETLNLPAPSKEWDRAVAYYQHLTKRGSMIAGHFVLAALAETIGKNPAAFSYMTTRNFHLDMMADLLILWLTQEPGKPRHTNFEALFHQLLPKLARSESDENTERLSLILSRAAHWLRPDETDFLNRYYAARFPRPVGMRDLLPNLDSPIPIAAGIHAHIRSGQARILVIHESTDAFGDELIRMVRILNGLTTLISDHPSPTPITLYTRRAEIYHHRHLTVRSFPMEDKGLYDLVIHTRIERGDHPAPIVYSRPRVAPNGFLVEIGGYGFEVTHFGENPIKHKPASAVIAGSRNHYLVFDAVSDALGLPMGKDITESVLGHPLVSTQKLDRFLEQNTERRPILVFNGFGGSYFVKGLRGLRDMAAACETLAQKGYFVVLALNHQRYGSLRVAQAILKKISPADRAYVDVYTHDRLETDFMELLRRSDFILSVEGGLIHLAHALGLAFGLLHVPHSGSVPHWFPARSTPLQFVVNPVPARNPPLDRVPSAAQLLELKKSA